MEKIFIATNIIRICPTVHNDTQRHEDVPLWFYFGEDVPYHNRTKIGRVRFLTYFGSAMSIPALGIKKYRKISIKSYFMENV